MTATTARLNPDNAYTDRRGDGSAIYWRTGRGSYRHASFYCANSKREIHTGDCTVIDPAEVETWAPCADCCTDADVAAATAAAAAKQENRCPNNRGVAKPGRIYSTCNVCGKEGKVIRSSGSIRAHDRAN